jgi:hypothetical protein
MLAVALAPNAIPHVRVAGEQQTVGSFEYLVYSSTLVGVAAQFGLKPVLDFKHSTLAALFEEVCASVWSGRGWGWGWGKGCALGALPFWAARNKLNNQVQAHGTGSADRVASQLFANEGELHCVAIIPDCLPSHCTVWQ